MEKRESRVMSVKFLPILLIALALGACRSAPEQPPQAPVYTLVWIRTGPKSGTLSEEANRAAFAGHFANMARRAYNRRVVVAFQPHRYSRTHHLFDELTRAFNAADVVLLTDVYSAGESPIEGADSAHLVQAMREHGHRDVHHVPDRADLVRVLTGKLLPGDVVVTMGAGSITQTGPELLEALSRA
jgi:hypothetical protein